MTVEEEARSYGLTLTPVTRWWKARRWLPKRPRLRYHITMGRESGFPSCCIAWYCAFAWLPDKMFGPPVWLWDRLRVPRGRGYVPCPRHYVEQ